MLVKPLPGTQAKVALDALAITLSELQRASQNHADAYSAYMRWAADQSQALAQHTAAATVESLVLTRRHWALCGVTNPNSEGSRTLLYAETATQTRLIENSIRELRERIDRWSQIQHFVVADTNVFLQYKAKLEDVDWRAIVDGDSEEQLGLIVPIAVIDELDRQKRANESWKRFRASYTLAVLQKVFATKRLAYSLPDPQVAVDLLMEEPGHVRLPIIDDEIVDRALEIHQISEREPCQPNTGSRNARYVRHRNGLTRRSPRLGGSSFGQRRSKRRRSATRPEESREHVDIQTRPDVTRPLNTWWSRRSSAAQWLSARHRHRPASPIPLGQQLD